ncbi:MAG: DUF418 domain-containing protein [Phycisphaerales bacterium]
MSDSTLPHHTDDRPPAQATLVPVTEADRIHTMDVARGFALLGILCVNIWAFAFPLGVLFSPDPRPGDGPLGIALHTIERIFCAGKFYPLFILLFGMGLAVQQVRAKAAGRPFLGLQARRLLVLACIGLTHIVALWYGDILLTYAIIGLAVFWALGAKPRVLLSVALILMLFGALLSGVFMGFTAGNQPATTPDQPSAAAWVMPAEPFTLEGGSPVRHMLHVMGSDGFQGPNTPGWMDGEAIGLRDGPFLSAMAVRLLTYGMYLFFLVFGGWQMVGLMLIGSVLVQTRFLSNERAAWQRTALLVAVVFGLPGVIAALYLEKMTGFGPKFASAILGTLCAPLMSLGYLSLWAILVRRGMLTGLTRLLAATGRMALTNYLTHTIVCTFVFQHWGLRQFASWSTPQMYALVFGLYAVQLPLSALWLSRFRFGPAEWVWRSLSYMRLQPMLRSGSAQSESD